MLQSILNYRLCREAISRINRMDDQTVRLLYSGFLNSATAFPGRDASSRNASSRNASSRDASSRDASRGNLHAYSTSFSNALFGQIGRNTPSIFSTRSGYDASGNNIVDECTETIVYDGNTMTETRCAISLEDFAEGEELYRLRACGHYFSKEPLRRWLTRRRHCPVCRTSVVQRQTDQSSTTEQIVETILNSLGSPSNEASYLFSLEIPLSSTTNTNTNTNTT